MPPASLTCRRLFVSGNGTVLRVDQNRPRPIPQWAQGHVLDVYAFGARVGRSFGHFVRFDFADLHLDNTGAPLSSSLAVLEALYPRTMDASVFGLDNAAGSIIPLPIPNATQVAAVWAYLTTHWPEAAAHPSSKQAWHYALHPDRWPPQQGLRYAPVPFRDR